MTIEEELDPETFERIKNEWKAVSGTLEAGGTPVLDNNAKLQEMNTRTAEDSQIIEALNNVSDVGRWLESLSPIQLGNYEFSHYSSLVADNANYYMRNVAPILNKLETELNKFYQGSDLYCEFNVDGLLRGDALTQAQIWQIANGNKPWMTGNEIRKLNGYPARPEFDVPTLVPIAPLANEVSNVSTNQ